MDNISTFENIFEPEWIVPKNIFALQTTRNTYSRKESSHINKIDLSTNFGLEFINRKEKGFVSKDQKSHYKD